MKILFLAPHLSTGGMPQFLLKRIQSLIEYTDNEYYVVEYQCHSLDFVVQRNAIKSLLLENFTTLYEDKMELFKIIEQWKPDIIHIDEPSERLDREMVKRLYHIDRKYRIIETCHDVSFNPDNEKLFHPDLYIFCTPYHEETFANMESKFVTIQYPIDKQEINAEKTGNHVVNVGLWTKGKNQREGIEIARKYPNFIFHFIGNQAENFKEYWEPLMKDLPKNVKVWGERKDVDTFMKGADIFMFNSTWECNPLVLREAISYGLPIIARNLPQYGDMFTKYLQPIDTDLNTIKVNYEIPTDNTTPIFAFRHEDAYNKVLSLPIQDQKVKVIQHFVNGPFLEVKGLSDSDFKVQFLDEKGSIAYENTIKANHWVRLNHQWFTKWTAKVWQDGELIYSNTLNLEGKTVFITIDTKALGDTMAFIPYCEAFRIKHKCNVIVSSFFNKILDYPNIKFIEPGQSINCYAMYNLGYFYDSNKEPLEPNKVPLQQCATNILGLDYTELLPNLKVNRESLNLGRYVTIATNSTAQCKFWQRKDWQRLINYLHSEGYKVINISKETNLFDNCEPISDTSIEYTMQVIAGAEFQVSLSSGLSWLAWGVGTHVFLISNFTAVDYEFSTKCTRIVNPKVCHDCWSEYRLDPSNWYWCPRNNNFICHTSINADMVINKIKEYARLQLG
jgi:autotransporter strand-loop-strand O-heptosyltransferase